MKCYFCSYEDPTISAILGLNCPKCPIMPGVMSSKTYSHSAEINFKINGQWMIWSLLFKPDELPVCKLRQVGPNSKFTTLFSTNVIPNITASNVVEKTKMYLIFS